MSVRVGYCLYAIPPEGKGEPFVVGANRPHVLWSADQNQSFKDYCASHTGSYEITRRYYAIPPFLADHTFEMRRFVDTAWRNREAGRLADGTYNRLPSEWSTLKLPEDHFCHIANGGNEADYIAYTENSGKGERDIQTRMRAGKYLKKVFPDMSNENVRRYASALLPKDNLHFTDDPETAAKVYEGGPSSCMAKDQWAWTRNSETIDPMPRHPVAVYFAGDLQLAWLGSADAATARALVWPEKKLYGRIYGDVTRLATALQREGYSNGYDDNYNKTFYGARLKLIHYNRDYIVMPYLDGISYLEFVVKTGFIHIGQQNKRAGLEAFCFSQDENQNGVTSFRDPVLIYCAITGNPIPKDAVKVEVERAGNYSTEAAALAADYQMTVEGFYSLQPIIICDEQGRETVHVRDYQFSRREYVADRMEQPRRVFRLRSMSIQYDKNYFTSIDNVDKMICYDGHYYTSMERLYLYHPDAPCIVSWVHSRTSNTRG